MRKEETSIQEFISSQPGEEYYAKLVEELVKLNKEFGAFNNINSAIRSGYPLSVKDNICVKGLETTASSKVLKGYVPPFDATAVERLAEKGFGVIGKTNMDEFGFGSFGLNSENPARNPFDKNRVAGGSSSGAAIAASIIDNHVALAESTGGSIAAPASFCGVVGFTPTYGVVSRYGLIDYGNSLDKIGLMARKAAKVKYAFDIIRGKDRYDATCIDMPEGSEKKSASKKLFVIRNLLENVDEKVKKSFERTLSTLSGMGFEIEEGELKELDSAIAVYYIIAMSEASTNLAKYTGFKYGNKIDDFSKEYNEFFTEAREAFGKEAKRRIILGTYIRSASVRDRYYYKALQIRRLIGKKILELAKRGHIVLPTMPMLPPKIEDAGKMSPLQAYMVDILTVPANLTGLPHVSFPTDYIDGLPVGTQIIGAPYDDYAILDAVDRWEEGFSYKFAYNLGSL
ncbi:MAG: amidase family protein [Candidatus Micrarchaeia archaeon]